MSQLDYLTSSCPQEKKRMEVHTHMRPGLSEGIAWAANLAPTNQVRPI